MFASPFDPLPPPSDQDLRQNPVTPWGKASATAEWTRWWQTLAENYRSGDPAMQLAANQGFVLTRAQLRACGHDEPAIRRGLRAGTLWSPRRGILAMVAVSAPTTSDVALRRLAERRRAALSATGAALANQDHVISGRSAAVLSGLPLFREPDEPQLTAADPVTMGRRGGVLARPATISSAERTTWFGVPMTTVARTLVDLARHDRWDGVIAADAALRDGLVCRHDMERALARACGWPGVRRARSTLEFADARSESPLESLTRLRLHYSGLPMPEPQVWIRVGRLRYRADLCWRAHRLILEADGRMKYTDDTRWDLPRTWPAQRRANWDGDSARSAEDEQPSDPLWQEKVREEHLRRAGFRVLRVMWDDIVFDWPATLSRIRTALNDPASPMF